jgi:cob(I)alamin adenosyltransferase
MKQGLTEDRKEAKGSQGLILVNTGEGKGKTTAALGILLRAWGRGMKVVLIQFMKRSADYGEHRAVRQLGVEMLTPGSGFTWQGVDAEKSRSQALALWEAGRGRISSGEPDIVILDEFSYPLRYGWIPLEEVLEVLRARPHKVHVVITGRGVPQELIDAADLVTEMREVKHPFRKGVKAQPGIEF